MTTMPVAERMTADELVALRDRPWVEVRSPSTWRCDVGAKRRGYERRGLPEPWLVDSVAQRVLVFRRDAAQATRFADPRELVRGDVLRSPAMPHFALALDELFAELPR